MRTCWLALCPSLAALAFASAASASEIALEFDQKPELALIGPGGTDMRFARYTVSGIGVELEALGSGFGYVETLGVGDPNEDVSADVVADGHTECGNQPDCNPFVATFSIALDGVGVDFLGVGDFSGGHPDILSSAFFLEAYSGPGGTGTLLASVVDPGGAPGADLPFGGSALPASLSLSAAGIRSIVFGGTTLARDEPDPHNLSIVERVRMSLAPEPSTGALLALGVGMLAVRRRTAR